MGVFLCTMAEGKKSFVLYADQKELFEQLPNEKAGELIKHIFAYVNDESPQNDDLIINMAFTPIKQQLKRDLEKWEQRRIKRSEAGKASAKARANKAQQTSTNSTSVESVEHTSTKSTVTVNDNVNVNVNVNDIKKDIFNTWLDYRRQIKKPVKVESTLSALAKRFNENTLEKCEWVVNNSIENNYQGLFWDNFKQQNKNNTGSTPFASPIL